MTHWVSILIFMFKEITVDKAIIYFVLIIAIIIAGPMASIWALNTLFPVLAIPYTFDTWLAMLLVGGAFRGSFGNK